MGVVHRAHDVDLDRPVAIKLLHAGAAADPTLVERFLREARSAAQLVHPHVALVYQVGRHEGQTFIVMEWLAGGDLAQALQPQGRLPWREAVAALRDAAAGLAAAHAVGLVHRDIKPSNLMRDADGRVKLVDFGLARLHELPSDLTLSGSILGTPAYLSPEQCRGEVAGPASDQYALACTGFHLLAGRAPFHGPHLAAVLQGHVNLPMPDARELAADVPEVLARLLQRAGAKAPAERFAGAAQLQAALQAVLDGVAPASAAAVPAAPAPPVAPPAATWASTLPLGADESPPASAGPAAPAVAADDQPTLTAASSAAPAGPLPGNLPLDTTSFIGRHDEAAQLAGLLRQSRLVTLTGPGGTGKTRLALHLARQLAHEFADGAWLVALAPLAAESEAAAVTLPGGSTPPPGNPVTAALAALFGLRDETGRSAEDRLLDHLQPLRLLLVLDNCEHLVHATAALAHRVHQRRAGVRMLATSRQALGVPGELTLGVPPLPTGAPDTPPAELARIDAIRLFAERAAAARPGFQLDAGSAVVVAQICRRLDGIPLAIELAAARVKVLAPAQIAARLDDVFRLLTGGQRALLPRQQTLRALIDWSWNLLAEPERQLLARASVFAGEFTLEAAEAVLTDHAHGADAVLDGLAALVDQSLLLAVERDDGMHYRLLETIRQYAAEKLADAGQQRVLQRRHAVHYRRATEAEVAALQGPAHAQAVRALQRDRDNAHAALDTVTEQRWFDIGLPLARALADLWFWQGTLADGVARIERLMAQQPPQGVELARLLQLAGRMAVYLGRQPLAQTWFEQGLQVLGRTAVQTADIATQLALEADLLGGLGTLAVARGELPKARQCFERAVHLCRGADADRRARAHNNLGVVLSQLGETDGARQHLAAALELHRATDNPSSLANGLMSLGDLEQAAGQHAVAQALFSSSLDLFASLGDDWAGAYAQDGLGRCALDTGDLAAARHHFEAALSVLRRLGDQAAMADQLDSLAQVALHQGERDRAAPLAEQALALRLALENPAALAASMETHAALWAPGQPERSARLLGRMTVLLESAQARFPAARQARAVRLAQALQGQLGPQRFEQLWAEGARQDPATLARG